MVELNSKIGTMKKKIIIILLTLVLFAGISKTDAQENKFELKKELPNKLKEISGITKDGDELWAIVDTKNADIYKLNLNGNIIQTIHLLNYKLKDVEAVSSDNRFLYVGDVGDNNGTRESRTIIRIAKSSLGDNPVVNVEGELINFTFPDEGHVKKKKGNNYDCEAMVSFGDSLYVFTKRRDDMKTELYVLPKLPGNYPARSITVFKTKGLVTDAAVNEKRNEIALVGYDEGHTRPFIWILSKFSGNNFFSGSFKRFELTNEKKLDWQVESITYKNEDSFYIACEKSTDIKNTLYLLPKTELMKSKKGDSK